MIKRILITELLILLIYLPVSAQTKPQDLKREVTLYNPYKPSLPEVKKRSFLPDINDTAKVRPDFRYDIKTNPFTPVYTISPIKAAALLPDPLPKLYKSYINLGLGNYLTPLAELSITNERSKKGALGFYARHFSTNGKVKLQNDKRVFAGYMDNDASLFGKKFYRKNFLEGSVDFNQKVRYAYGYDTTIKDFDPVKKDIRMGYNNIGAKISFASLTLDSANFSYDFDFNYDFFFNTRQTYMHNAGFTGVMSKTYKGFYVGSGINYDYFKLPETISNRPKYILSLSPFIKKNTPQWNFKVGFELLFDYNMTTTPVTHIYPDVSFGFNIVPSYLSFFTGLNGKLEINEPKKIINENPFLVTDGTLFKLPNTSHALVVNAGLKGNTGIGGNYIVGASYSFINNMLFYSNLTFPDPLFTSEYGNRFIPLTDDVELLKIYGEINGVINKQLSYAGKANWYKYTLTNNDYPWNKPLWDGQIAVKYNLRDKIIAGMEFTGTGKRKLIASTYDLLLPPKSAVFEVPVHFNLNISAEYRFTKILSFWLKINNITYDRYYEWAYYPSKSFLCMVGFTYSL